MLLFVISSAAVITEHVHVMLSFLGVGSFFRHQQASTSDLRSQISDRFDDHPTNEEHDRFELHQLPQLSRVYN